MSEVKTYEHIERIVLKAIQYNASDPNSKEDIKKFISDIHSGGVAYIEVPDKGCIFILYSEYDDHTDAFMIKDGDYVVKGLSSNSAIWNSNKYVFEEKFKEIASES